MRARMHRRNARGFTLIEILVVVAIVGVLSAAMLLSVSLTGRDRELEKESDRLDALLGYAREQAELQTREYGVMFQDDGYTFLTYDTQRDRWRRVSEDDALDTRQLPDGLELSLVVDGRAVVLTRPKDATDLTPQVILYSGGDLTSFSATVARISPARSVTITVDDKNQIVEQDLVEQKP
ncbi:MAG: type II secretion system minor pseudopilin GspH [Proteobacteria bacterium]|nr:type II secretion system minor pseudopilin GspH [Pseudomonadota bacterium]